MCERWTWPPPSPTSWASGSATAPTGALPSPEPYAGGVRCASSARDFATRVRISGRRWKARRRRVVRRRLRQLGSGNWASLYTGIGPHRRLLGRSADGLARSAAADTRASIARAGALARVRRAGGIVPAQIAGDLHGGEPGARRDIAVAVNGRIEAVGRSFYLAGDPTEHYTVMVPERSLREGRNAIAVFEVTRAGALRPLAAT